MNDASAVASERHTLHVTLVIALAFFMELFDATVIVTALPTMAQEFGKPVVSLSLGLTAYMLCTAVLLPASGWISDRYGARTVFCCATALFILASVWCGLTHSVHEFVLARCVQGIGAALMSPVGRLMVLRTTPKSQLVRVTNLLVVPALIGPVLGPPVGGLITTYASWRWCFFVNVPIGLFILWYVYRNTPNLGSEERRDFDVTGFVINGIALAALIYGMDDLAQTWPGTPLSLGCIALGLVFGVLSVRHTQRAAEPLVNLQPLRLPSFRVANLTGGNVFRLSIAAPLFLMPLMFQVGMGMSAFASGMLILTHTGGDLLMKAFTRRFMNLAGFRGSLIGTAAVFSATMLVCATFTVQTPPLWIAIVLFVGGAARSLQMTALNSLQFADTTSDELTNASTLSNILQQTQRALGVALGAILLNFALSWRTGDTHVALTQADFQAGFVMMSVIGLASLFWYLPMKRNIGAHLLQRD